MIESPRHPMTYIQRVRVTPLIRIKPKRSETNKIFKGPIFRIFQKNIHLDMGSVYKSKPSFSRVIMQVVLANELSWQVEIEVRNNKTQKSRIEIIKVDYDVILKVLYKVLTSRSCRG